MLDFKNKIAVVTGASRGIGYATCLALAEHGAHVIALARTQGALQELSETIKDKQLGKITCAVVDLCQAQQVQSFINSVQQRFGTLDILLGNAAMLGELTPVSQLSSTSLQSIFTLNFLANQWLIAGFENLLKANPNGQAAFVTSGITTHPRAFWSAYGASKAALEYLVLSWADELKQTSLKINLLNPGVVATKMRAQAYPGEDPKQLVQCQDLAIKILPHLHHSNKNHGKIIQL